MFTQTEVIEEFESETVEEKDKTSEYWKQKKSRRYFKKKDDAKVFLKDGIKKASSSSCSGFSRVNYEGTKQASKLEGAAGPKYVLLKLHRGEVSVMPTGDWYNFHKIVTQEANIRCTHTPITTATIAATLMNPTTDIITTTPLTTQAWTTLTTPSTSCKRARKRPIRSIATSGTSLYAFYTPFAHSAAHPPPTDTHQHLPTPIDMYLILPVASWPTRRPLPAAAAAMKARKGNR
jgi:hypothetical protein